MRRPEKCREILEIVPRLATLLGESCAGGVHVVNSGMFYMNLLLHAAVENFGWCIYEWGHTNMDENENEK